MSEQEIREGMLLAVWDEPPLDFDPDVLIKRVEQKKSRRRALVAVGVATAMIAVASFALPGLLPRDRDSQLGSEVQASASAAPSSAPSAWPDNERIQTVGDAMAKRLGQLRPQFADVYASLVAGDYSSRGTTFRPRQPGEPDMSGFVNFTDDIGPTSVRVDIGKLGFVTNGFCAGALSCENFDQPDGSVVTEAEFTDGGPDIVRADSVRVFPDGFVVRAATYNYNQVPGSGLRKTVPVRVGVLTALVTDTAVPWR